MLNKIYPKKLFLVDSVGALLSAVMLGLVLASFESIFGMPPKVLYILAAIAGVFFIHSMRCYLTETENWRPRMKIIGMANLAYCCLTLVLVICLFQKLTVLGLAYFVIEIILVTALAMFELSIALSSSRN